MTLVDTRWAVMVGVAVGLFLIRLSFIQLVGLADDVPDRVEQLLRLVPPAVLAALVFPDLLIVEGALAPTNDRVLAGAVGLVVAWRTADILRTLLVGMGALWLVKFVL